MWLWASYSLGLSFPNYKTSSILSTKCRWAGEIWGGGLKRSTVGWGLRLGGEVESRGTVRGKGSPKLSPVSHSWEGEHQLEAQPCATPGEESGASVGSFHLSRCPDPFLCPEDLGAISNPTATCHMTLGKKYFSLGLIVHSPKMKSRTSWSSRSSQLWHPGLLSLS